MKECGRKVEAMNKIDLNGTWKLSKADDSEFIDVKIPGSVLSGLLENNQINDPFDRMNEYKTRDLFWNDYEFARFFTVDTKTLKEDQIVLVCEGLDTLAEISVNGRLIAITSNMHRIWRFPVKEYLVDGSNEIHIIFRSVLQYNRDYQTDANKIPQFVACGAMKGNELIRKAHSMFGWDWGPQLPDAGIYRNIYLEAYSEIKIKEIRIHQEHDNGIKVRIGVLLEGEASEKYKIRAVITEVGVAEEGCCEESGVDEHKTEFNFEIKEPKLWWPNGYGEQNLYCVKVQVKDGDGNILQEEKKNIGLRTLTISQMSDQWGKEFAFIVNGIRIFARGGNYIPEDCVYSRITEEKQEYLLESCKRANFNCIRIWGGGYYPTDAFYDICDKKGLIIWQDLMFACNVYDVTDEFAKNCEAEILDNVRRLRHHACLGVWCGNNEIESAWDHWPDFQKESMYLRADYIKLFEMVLPKAVREADGDTFYWPSSPSSGGSFDSPDDENRGDAHYWDVWHGMKPFTDYRNHYFRFCSEFGFQSFPSMKTVRTFTRETDRNIFSRVMESHQKNNSANGKMLFYLSENFKYPKDFQHLLYCSQILQGMAVKSGVDHWRRNRGRCMGALYWQINDNWPAPSWSGIDYFGRWKALHYMAKKFFAPISASLVLDDGKVALYLASESKEKESYTARLYIKNMDCEIIEYTEQKGSIDPFSSKAVLEITTDSYIKIADSVFLEGIVTLDSGIQLNEVETLLPYKYMELKRDKVKAEVTEEEDEFILNISSSCFTPFVELDFDHADVIFEDNYFHLTDRQPLTVRLKKSDIYKGRFENALNLKDELRVCTLAESWEV
ncbi:MAG: beta-mannosidase [Lacrimispora sp.]|nr:beta-mannosidase [Lacrimispora sp.]